MSEDAQEAIKQYLQDGGSATKQTLFQEIHADEIEVTRALGELVRRGAIEEHPEIEGAFRLTDDR